MPRLRRRASRSFAVLPHDLDGALEALPPATLRELLHEALEELDEAAS
jgi:hypothetical protein